jgi:hypothetical protein
MSFNSTQLSEVDIGLYQPSDQPIPAKRAEAASNDSVRLDAIGYPQHVAAEARIAGERGLVQNLVAKDLPNHQ